MTATIDGIFVTGTPEEIHGLIDLRNSDFNGHFTMPQFPDYTIYESPSTGDPEGVLYASTKNTGRGMWSIGKQTDVIHD